MNHASLFSGIGGFDLAAEWAGWNNVLQVEIDPFCLKVLAHHFPNAQRFTDVKQFDGKPWAGKIDVLSGGFPCQPYSTAGKRLGKEDERHLWPEMCRIIQEIRPRWVIGENVYGLVNWNGGLVFEEVQTDLESCGYEVWPCILPACGVGAPHRRDRIFFIAHAYNDGTVRTSGEDAKSSDTQGIQERNEVQFVDQSSELWDAPNAECEGLERCAGTRLQGDSKRSSNIRDERDVADTNSKRQESSKTNRKLERKRFGQLGEPNKQWQNFPTQSPICGGDDGISRQLDGITFPKWRNESVKSYGNAVVPQVVYQIFETINRYEER